MIDNTTEERNMLSDLVAMSLDMNKVVDPRLRDLAKQAAKLVGDNCKTNNEMHTIFRVLLYTSPMSFAAHCLGAVEPKEG